MAGCRGRPVRRSGLDRAVLSDGDWLLVVAAVVGVSTGTGLSAPVGADPSSSGSFARVEQPRRPPLPPPAAPGADPTQVAIAWLQAYRTLRYDEPVDAWVDRVRPVVTPGLAATYEHGRAAGPGQDWQRWVARRCDGAVEDGVAIVAAEAPRTSDEVNVQVSGNPANLLRQNRSAPRPGRTRRRAARRDAGGGPRHGWPVAGQLSSVLTAPSPAVVAAAVAVQASSRGATRGVGDARGSRERRPRGRPPAHRRHPSAPVPTAAPSAPQPVPTATPSARAPTPPERATGPPGAAAARADPRFSDTASPAPAGQTTRTHRQRRSLRAPPRRRAVARDRPSRDGRTPRRAGSAPPPDGGDADRPHRRTGSPGRTSRPVGWPRPVAGDDAAHRLRCPEQSQPAVAEPLPIAVAVAAPVAALRETRWDETPPGCASVPDMDRSLSGATSCASRGCAACSAAGGKATGPDGRVVDSGTGPGSGHGRGDGAADARNGAPATRSPVDQVGYARCVTAGGRRARGAAVRRRTPRRGRRNKARRRGDGPRRKTVGQLVPVSRHQRLLRVRDVDRAPGRGRRSGCNAPVCVQEQRQYRIR